MNWKVGFVPRGRKKNIPVAMKGNWNIWVATGMWVFRTKLVAKKHSSSALVKKAWQAV